MSLQKLKQTLNYILNVTEECVIVDAAESAFVHLDSVEKELQKQAEKASGIKPEIKEELESLSNVCLDNCDYEELSDLRDKAQSLWDKANDLADEYTTLASEIDALESEIQSSMDNCSDDSSDDDNDYEGSDEDL